MRIIPANPRRPVIATGFSAAETLSKGPHRLPARYLRIYNDLNLLSDKRDTLDR